MENGEVKVPRSDLAPAKKGKTLGAPRATAEDFEKLGCAVTRSNVIVDWQEIKGEGGILFPNEQAKLMAESELNVICKVLAVGPEVRANGVVLPGKYVFMGGAGRLTTLNGKTYAIIKEHMVDAVFDTPPTVGQDQGESNSGIVTSATAREVAKFAEKHKQPNILDR